MIKRRLLKKHSRHTAMLMAVALACTNTGMAASTAFAQELGAELEEGGNEQSSDSSSENGGGGGNSGSSEESGNEGGSVEGDQSGSEGEGEGSAEDGQSGSEEEGEGSAEGGQSGSEEEGEGSAEGGQSGSEEEGEGSAEGGQSGSEEEGEGSAEGGQSGSEGEGEGSAEDESEGSTEDEIPGETEEEKPDETLPQESEPTLPENTTTPSGGAANAPAAPDVKPNAEKAEYTVTYTVNPEEAAQAEGDTVVEEGEALDFTVTVTEGYGILLVTANGEELEPVEQGEDGIYTYQIADVSEDLDIEVEAEAAVLKANGTETIFAEADDLTFELESDFFTTTACSLEVETEPILGSMNVDRYIRELKKEVNWSFKDDGIENPEINLIGYYTFGIHDGDKYITSIDEPVTISVEGLNLRDMNPENYKVFASGASNFIECDSDSIEVTADGVIFTAVEPRRELSRNNFSDTLSSAYTSDNMIIYAIVKRVVDTDKVPVVDYSSELNNLRLPDQERYENSSEIRYETDNRVAEEQKTKVVFTIPETYDGSDLTISAEEIVNEAFAWKTEMGYQPGDEVQCEVIIKNESPYDLEYVPGSFGFDMLQDRALQTSPLIIHGNSHSATTDPKRLRNGAIALLLGNGAEPTDANVEAALIEKGYSGIDDLYKYYIDYYNIYNSKGDIVNSLDEISLDDIEEMILNKGDAVHDSEIKETDPTMSEFLTAVFYHRYLNILPESYTGEETDYNLASYALGENDAFEDDAKLHFATIKSGEESEPLIFAMKINGNANDTYLDYQFGFNFGAEFVKAEAPDPEPTPTPDPDPTPGNSGGGSGSGGGGGNPGGHADRTPEGGPGVVINDPEVPLAALPEIGEPVMIPEEEVPLAALPKTGEGLANEITFLVSGLLLGLYGILGIRKKEDQ